jgi:[acyl-carrier-protein] S-malonyltransferase
MTAFLFPGQASQFVGMGADLYSEFASARRLFDEADEVLGTRLTSICFEGPIEALTQTAVTQPAVFVHSCAAAQLLQEQGLVPSHVAGHSLGEYSALVAAGAISFSKALELVRERGRLMQHAGELEPGKMAAIIGMDDDSVKALCAEVSAEGDVVPANFNAPGQVVVSGTAAAVDELAKVAPGRGAKRVIELTVSGAFHSKLMAPAAAQMEAFIAEAELRAPQVPIITNVSAGPIDDVSQLRAHLIAQITSPVRWTETLSYLAGAGVNRALEVGPGAVLKGMARRAKPAPEVQTAGTAEEIPKAVAWVQDCAQDQATPQGETPKGEENG